MSKRAEYNIMFYKKTDPFGQLVYIFDANAAVGEKKRLSFIGSMDAVEIEALIDVLTSIQNGQSYDPTFLEDSEIYPLYDVEFSNPNFSVGGVQTIHRNDLKQLLQEWQDFIKS